MFSKRLPVQRLRPNNARRYAETQKAHSRASSLTLPIDRLALVTQQRPRPLAPRGLYSQRPTGRLCAREQRACSSAFLPPPPCTEQYFCLRGPVGCI